MHSIAIDIRMINSSGIGTYLQNIVPIIIKNNPTKKFYLMGNINLLKEIWINQSNIELINCQAPIYSLSEQISLIKYIPKNVSLFWSPHYNIPIYYKGKLIVTVHDMSHLALTDYKKKLTKKIYSNFMFNKVINNAQAIICVSKFSAKELIKLKNADPRKIFIIHNGINNSFFNINNKKSMYNQPYLLFVGNVKPHKNLCRLIDVFGSLINTIPHNLIIVGKKEGFITGDKKVLVKAEKFKTRIKFTGNIDNEQLKKYYFNADALVFPSLYEGFGFPPLEAMACGCPVAVSNVASLPEVCGDAALYFDPFDTKDIERKILQIIQDQDLRISLMNKGLEHIKKFSWDNSAKKIMKIIDQVIIN